MTEICAIIFTSKVRLVQKKDTAGHIYAMEEAGEKLICLKRAGKSSLAHVTKGTSTGEVLE